MNELRAEAERVIRLSMDDQYVGGQELANMVLALPQQISLDEDERSIIVRALLAVRPHVAVERERDAVDSLMRRLLEGGR